MMMMRRMGFLAAASMLFAFTPATAAGFSVTFDWGNLKKCTSGTPNTVPNPRFRLRGVPAGTASIQFRMVDLAVPSYPHGGGTAKYAGGSTIEPGVFKYRSPCPPAGRHTYEWTAVAKDSAGKTLAQAKARKAYP